MSKIVDGIAKDLKDIPEILKAKTGNVDKKKLILMNLSYIIAGYFCDKVAWLWRVSPGNNASDKMMAAMNGLNDLFSNPLPSFFPKDLLNWYCRRCCTPSGGVFQSQECQEVQAGRRVRFRKVGQCKGYRALCRSGLREQCHTDRNGKADDVGQTKAAEVCEK